MDSPHLSNLPTDIQSLICSRVWAISPESLRALSAVNRSFSSAAKPYLYRYLSISVNKPENLIELVKQIEDTDIGKNYLRHTRHLAINGRIRHFSTPHDTFRQPVDSESTPPKPIDTLRPGHIFDLEEDLHVPFGQVFSSDGHLNTPEEDAKAWEPLVLLLAQFQNLKNLIYQCQGRFAPGMIGVIHQYHPACKVHLRQFRFKSLRDSVTDPDELVLVASPCLHSLSVLVTRMDSKGVFDHNNAAALSTVTFASNLKHLRILGCRPASSAALHFNRKKPTEVWKGFIPAPNASKGASLKSLSFNAYASHMDKSKLKQWSEHVDLSTIQRLSFEVSDGDVLYSLGTYNLFSNLEELDIVLQRSKMAEHFNEMAELFFRNIKPLGILKVSGTIHEGLLSSICQQHGSTIKKLTIRPYDKYSYMAGSLLQIEEIHIRMLGEKCPNLSNINITIKRTKGDERETRCYEAFRAFQNLRLASIHLDCSSAPVNGDIMHSYTISERTALEFETALINSAIDETLVTSIWEIICDGCHENPLECLTITSNGGTFGIYRPTDFLSISNNISRSYEITKTVRNDQSELVVVDLSKSRDEENEQKRKDEQTKFEKFGFKSWGGPVYIVFNRLWPFDEEKGNWREVWKSFPLQRTR